MDTTINERVKEIADKLCGGNISEMARIVGMKQPSLNDVVKGKLVKPGFDVIYKIVDNSTLNISSDWLITGEGEMQRDKKDTPYSDIGNALIPVYDINTAANLQTLFTSDGQHLVGEIKIPNAPACDGAIYVRGDSMYPLVKTGDLVAYKKLNNIQSVISGEMYVVDFEINGDDFLVVKYVQKVEEGNLSNLRLVSYNQHHKDIVIPRSAVRAVAIVKIVIRVNSMV